jgi:hypothetical protein
MSKNDLKNIAFDYECSTPCKTCRKRTSCLVRPKEGKCTSHEEGTPWVMPYREPVIKDPIEEIIYKRNL